MSGVSKENILQFLTAAAKGDIDTIKGMIANGVDLDISDVKGRTALMAASLKGQLEIVKFLVQSGAKVESASTDGLTAIDLARKAGNTDIIRYLGSSNDTDKIFEGPNENSESVSENNAKNLEPFKPEKLTESNSAHVTEADHSESYNQNHPTPESKNDANIISDAISAVERTYINVIRPALAILAILIFCVFIFFSCKRQNDLNNNAQYQFDLGYDYFMGFSGKQKDYDKAFEWLKKAVIQGHETAHAYLGIMYYYGYGCSKDYKKAYAYLKSSEREFGSDGTKIIEDIEKNLSLEELAEAHALNKKLLKHIEKNKKSADK